MNVSMASLEPLVNEVRYYSCHIFDHYQVIFIIIIVVIVIMIIIIITIAILTTSVLCPNDCSGHGVCTTIGDIALFHGKDYDTSSVYAGDAKGVVYTNWDKSSIIMCKCDYGYFGASCDSSELLSIVLFVYATM